ncbi:YadA C-terminal domain-containing protein [Pasteurella multocida]|uniref:YadA C-terminal domain-containing protein n=1 Tax=Pasteurella multocida TaxID=747 RepID=UPI002100464C
MRHCVLFQPYLFQPYNVNKFNLTATFGGYQSQTAIAIGYRFNEKLPQKRESPKA